MKLTAFIILLCCFTFNKAQSIIDDIDQRRKNQDVIRLEDLKTESNDIYEKTTIYLQKDVPILIQKENHTMIHARHTDGNRSVSKKAIIANFYITDWNKNTFIRTGHIETTTQLYNNVVNQPVTKTSPIPDRDSYVYNRNTIEEIIRRNKTH